MVKISLCINPYCPSPENEADGFCCQSCGSSLLISQRYRVIKALRTGGDFPSNLYEAIDFQGHGPGRTKAKIIKVLKSNANPKYADLFNQEYVVLRLLTQKGFTHIPRVEAKDSYFQLQFKNYKHRYHCLVMDKIEGQNLEIWRKHNDPPGEKLVTSWVIQLATLLAKFHQLGYVHRDIKPSNIMVMPNLELALIDFGTVRVTDSPTFWTKVVKRDLTQVISHGYTAPEQTQGRGVPCSDIYAFGKTMVYGLVGIHPSELTGADTNWRSLTPNVSEKLGTLLDKLMAPKVSDRLQSWQEIIMSAQGKNLDLLIEEPGDVSTPPETMQDNLQDNYPLGPPVTVLSRRNNIVKITGNITSKIKHWGKAYGLQSLVGITVTSSIVIWQASSIAIFFGNQGIHQFNRGNIELAQPLLSLAHNLNPEDDLTLMTLGRIYDSQRDFNQASVFYTAMGTDFLAYKHNLLARLDLLQGNIDSAKEQLATANHYLPVSASSLSGYDQEIVANVYKNWGWLYLQQRDFDQANTNLEQAISIYPDFPDTYCLLAQVKTAQGDPDHAVEHWNNCRDKLTSNYNHYPDEVNDWLDGVNLLI